MLDSQGSGIGPINLQRKVAQIALNGTGAVAEVKRNKAELLRIWLGTQRHLLSGNPEMSIVYSKAFGFCGRVGDGLVESLPFKGRRGSGFTGERCAHLDESLSPNRDWGKYPYIYRVFGRLACNLATDADVWYRYLVKQLAAGARTVESALLYYRRVDRPGRFKFIEMKQSGRSYRAAMSTDYASTLYPLQYYVGFIDGL